MKKLFFFCTYFLSVLFCFSQSKINCLGHLSYSDKQLNDVWGWHYNNKEYAIVGTFTGISIVDVSVPSTPIELYFLETVGSIWKDIKTYQNYAYVTHGVFNGIDSEADGLLIIDLETIGNDTLTYYKNRWEGIYTTAHNLFIDESRGRAYIFGAEERGGALILDLSENPTSPKIIGNYDQTYLHDGFVQDDILYACADKWGRFLIIDVSQADSPKEIVSSETPNRTTHNAWLSADKKTLFTTDEKVGAYISSFDISDTYDIKLLGKVRANDSQRAIPHNAMLKEDFIISSYYSKGLRIFDATFPDAMVEVAGYKTSGSEDIGQFEGAWGVYPYLPSGNVLVSDISTGLHILSLELQKAAYLKAFVCDENRNPIYNAEITLSDNTSYYTDFYGNVSLAKADTFVSSAVVSVAGYQSQKVVFSLRQGEQENLDVVLKNSSLQDEQLMESYVKVYPNPFYEDRLLNVEYHFSDELSPSAAIVVFDMRGRQVYFEELKSNDATIILGKELPIGVYMLRIFNGSKYSEMFKVVKN